MRQAAASTFGVAQRAFSGPEIGFVLQRPIEAG
jgi:hypothetical protein